MSRDTNSTRSTNKLAKVAQLSHSDCLSYLPRITRGEQNFHAMGHHGQILYPIIVSMSLAKRLAPYPQEMVTTSNKARNSSETPPDW